MLPSMSTPSTPEPEPPAPVQRSTRRVRAVAVLRRHLTLLPAVIVAAVANTWALTSAGWGNAYYAAAVRSMSGSWHDFFFASFDAGFVSVDKPPLSLWVQVASVKILGYSQAAVLLPQALAGVAAVVLLGVGVGRSWGRLAGAVAALALATTPMAVMVAHSNNTDAVLVLCMTAAAVAAMEAARAGRLRWLLIACVCGGLAVTAKMAAAVPVLPGILGAYLWCAPRHWRVRVVHALGGALVLVASGGWWFTAVALTDADHRPYVGSTRTNSVFELAVERNGVNQVEGSGPDAGPGRGRMGRPEGNPGSSPGATAGPTGALGGLLPGIPVGGADGGPPGGGAGSGPVQGGPPGSGRPGSGGLGFGPPGGGPGGAGLGFGGGEPGPLRLLNRDLGAQAGWLIPLAAAAALGVVVLVGWRGSPRLGSAMVLGAWALAAGLIFSRTQGILHPYYTAQLAPPLAGLSGMGVAAHRGLAARRGWTARIGRAILPTALLVTAWTQRMLLQRFDWRPWLVPLTVCALIICALVMIPGRTSLTRPALVAVAVAPLVAPAMWTQGSLASGVNPMLPYADPVRTATVRRLGGGVTPNGGTRFPTSDTARLVSWLRRHRNGERYLVAVPSAAVAEPIIIGSGDPVMTLGGFIGGDPILTADGLRARVGAGEVRYVLASSGGPGGMGGPFGSNAAMSWVTSSCLVVDAAEWGGDQNVTGAEAAFAGGPSGAGFTLYDCA